MLKAIFGSEQKGKILLYIYTHGESYPAEIGRALGRYIYGVQNQLMNLERSGMLCSRLRGKVRLYGINPRYPFKKELEALFEKLLLFVPEAEKIKLYKPRLRPRLSGKPI